MSDERERIRRLTERVSLRGLSEQARPLRARPGPGRPARSPTTRACSSTTRTGDDAGVFRLDEQTALVQTVDFFTPVVDDPLAFGAIAAANALSDVYAMGGRPLTALSIAAFPERDFPVEWARGDRARAAPRSSPRRAARSSAATRVRDPEIKFGYAVTGLVDPDRMLTNAGGGRARCSC